MDPLNIDEEKENPDIARECEPNSSYSMRENEQGKNTKVWVACNYCGVTFVYDTEGNDTTNMLKHIELECEEYPYRMCDSEPKVLCYSPSNNIEGEGSSVLPDDCFSVQKCRDMLCRMIVIDGLSFKIVESKGFQMFCLVMQPEFVIPSWQAVVRECYRLYIKEKKELKKMLVKKEQKVCLSINSWTTIHNLDYMVLSAHFIDDDWKLHRRILNFCLIPDHKGDTIAKEIEKCLREWTIGKVFTFTIDDSICNDGSHADLAKKIRNGNAVVLNGELMHVRCCSHIVNLIVCDALKGFEDSIIKIRNAIKYVKSSPSRLETFKKFVRDEKISCKKLICLDTPNRWNSTYIMLDIAANFQKVFERLEIEDEQFCLEFIENESKPPLREDWDNARDLVKFLKFFHDLILRISRWSNITSQRFFLEICLIQEQILKYSRSDNPLFNDIVRNIKVNYEKYWGNIDKMNYILYVAIVLDPRCKLEFVPFTLSFLYGEERSNEIGKKVEDLVRRLYSDYQTSNMEGEISLMSMDQMFVEGKEEDENIVSRFAKHLIQKAIKENKTELDRYLSEPCEIADENFDILDWWKTNSSKYKILGKMAKDVFAIPLSTVTSEVAFSNEVPVLDSYRSLLPPTLVEAVICLQNWLRSPQAIDNYKPLDELEDLKNDDTCSASMDNMETD